MRRLERLAFAPLGSYLASIYRSETSEAGQVYGCSTTAMADMCKTTKRSVQRWRETGITWLQADEVAVGLGLHPCLIWGDAWWDTSPPPTQNEAA